MITTVEDVITECKRAGDVATIIQAVRNFRRNGYVGLSGLNPQDRALAAYEATLREMTSDDAYSAAVEAVMSANVEEHRHPQDPDAVLLAMEARRRLDAIREGQALLRD